MSKRSTARRRHPLQIDVLESRRLLDAKVQLVVDINATEIGAMPDNVTTLGDYAYFSAEELDGRNCLVAD